MAATLTSDNELIYASFPVEKMEETEDGDLLVWGKASDGTIDGDLQIVDPEWSLKALREWFDTGANVRVQHQAQRDPAGVGVELDGHYLKARVVEKEAKRLTKAGALGYFSIGISHPEILHGRHPLDPEGKAIGGIITGRKDGKSRIPEVSLVDRGSNFNSKFQLVKAAADGTCEYVGKMIGADDLLTKAAREGDDMVNVDLPKNASISISPADFAKLNTFKQRLVSEQATAEDAAMEAVKAAEAHVYKRDIDTATRRRLAKEGKALPDGSYPIESKEDLHNAAILARSGHGNVAAAKRLIARRAKELGVPNPLKDKKKGGSDASKGAAVSQPDTQDTTVKDADPEAVKADPGDEDGEGAMHHDDGEDDDTDSEADAMDKAAMPEGKPKMGKVPCPKCKAMCKPKAKFCGKCGGAMKAEKSAPTPGHGVVGQAAEDMKPVPVHREPDGMPMEAFEADSHVPDADRDSEMKAAARHRALNVPYDTAWLHDTLCPAFDPADVAKAYPHADLSMVDEHTWQAKALDIAATAPLEQARTAMDLWQHAKTLKAITPDLAADLALEAHKAFRDANPGPGHAPTPMELSAARYNRPYLREGHAAPSPGHDAPHTSPVHPEHLAASQFDRGPLTEGHAADSPGNDMHRPEPVPAPAVPGVPSRVYYSNTQRANARQAMQAMHDHIAATFPDLCSMHGPGHMGEPPSHARPVAPGVGGPQPHGAMKADGVETHMQPGETVLPRKTAKKAKAKLSKKDKQARAIVKAIQRTLPSFEQARAQAAANPWNPLDGEGGTVKAALPTAPAAPPVAAALDPETVEQIIVKAQAPLLERLDAQQKVLDAIADQPDPRVAAYRGPVLSKTSAPPAAQPSPRGYEDRVRANVLSTMYDQYRNSADPTLREEAWHFLLKEAGIDVTKNV